MPSAVCPECHADVHVEEDIDKGEVVHCDECDVTLEVVGLDPIELDLRVDEEDEDFDDYYGENDDKY